MLLVALAIAVSTAAGVAADRRDPARAHVLMQRVIALMLWGLLPPIAFFVVARLEITAGVGVGLLLAYAGLAVAGTLAWLVGRRVLRLERPTAGTLVLTAILVNSGYLGVPLCAALLGRDAIAPAVAYDTVVSAAVLYTAGFAIGAATGTKAGDSARERAKAFVTRNPVLVALILGLLAPDVLAPQVLEDVAEIAAFALLPLGFFVLGVNLTEEGRLPRPDLPIAVALGLRLTIAPAVVLGLSTFVDGVPDAYLLQAAMPTGINTLIVVHVYGLDLRLAAGAIAYSTTLVVAAATVAGLVA